MLLYGSFASAHVLVSLDSRTTLFLLSINSALAQSTARTCYVKLTATCTMDGTSWANAMTLQVAIDGYVSGDILYLMSGRRPL